MGFQVRPKQSPLSGPQNCDRSDHIGQTLRLQNLPAETTERDIEDFFDAQFVESVYYLHYGLDQEDYPEGVHPYIQRVGVIYSSPNSENQRATVTFWSCSLANWAKRFSNQEFRNSNGGASIVQIDDGFLGLTTIFSSTKSWEHETKLHIIAVHGLHGHAYNSYSTRQSVGLVGAEETMWLRDVLPAALQQHGLSPRVMTYGYDEDLSNENSNHFLDKITNQLRQTLRDERVLISTVPIIFLCHSFGGYIVKRTASPRFEFWTPSPVYGCVFFGTQHKQIEPQSALMTMLIPSDGALTARIKLAKIRQRTAILINDINHLFEECIWGDPEMRIVTCYETKKTNGIFIVDKVASSLNSPNAILVPVSATHRDLIRPNNTTGQSNPDFLKAIVDVAEEAVRLRSHSGTIQTHLTHPNLRASGLSSPIISESTKRGHSTASTRTTSPIESLDAFFLREDSFAYLTRFETVVLMDDSARMYGRRWQQASHLLAKMAKVVTKYDPLGFELHFLNEAGFDHVSTPESILEKFEDMPRGASRPIATLLESELSKYISRYRNNNELKGLNLLVVTSGIHRNEHQVLEVIYQASREMEVLKAAKEKISIQFIQIGSDKALRTFLEGFDDAYAVGLQSDHIVVDRIPYPEDADALLEKVLFGGIRQHYDEKAYEYATRSSNQNSLEIFQSGKLAERRKYQLATPSMREVLLAAMAKCYPRVLRQELHYETTFDLTWELLTFVRDNLEEDEKLSQVITLTGTQINAQASTCAQYIRECWPDLGPELLSFIEEICDQCLRQSGFSEVSMTTDLPRLGSTFAVVDISVKSNKTMIKVQGPLECQVKVTEILAWLTAAVRSSTIPSLSNSEVVLTFEKYETDSTVACFKLQPKPLEPIRDGHQMCWHPLFERSVIAVQFPYAERTQGVGVELSPSLMATLAGVRTAVEFRGGLVLRGLSTALIPLEETEGGDAIQWHLATASTSDDAIITELFGDLDEIEGMDEYYKVQDLQQLWEKKAYLGWCSVATVRLGTQEAKYQEVTWSDPSKNRRLVEFSGFSLSLGSAGLGFGGPTGTINFVIPKTQRTHFMDVGNQLKDRLNISIARPVIVYDTLDQRGWMIPTVCLMLYMMHLRARKLPKPLGASKDDLPMPYSKGDREAALEAYDILIRYMKPPSASTLGNSEAWNETLALLYIALDTFFGKSKELSSRSSASHSSEISGFELMDAVLAEKPFRYNSRQIQRNSGGWAQLGDIVGILFCRGIGDAIVPGAGANVLCSPWSSVPSKSDYLGAYVPCVIEVLSRQGNHKGSERLRERIGCDLYETCHHIGNSRCSHIQTYSQIADPPDDKRKRIPRATRDEAPASGANLLEDHRGAIIFGKTTRLLKPWSGT